MNRRSILISLGAALAAPAVIRTPGLLMPVREIPDRYVIRLGDGETLFRKEIVSPWRVEVHGNNAWIHECHFVQTEPDLPAVKVLDTASHTSITRNRFRYDGPPRGYFWHTCYDPRKDREPKVAWSVGLMDAGRA